MEKVEKEKNQKDDKGMTRGWEYIAEKGVTKNGKCMGKG
jgi:hypothetical protein